MLFAVAALVFWFVIRPRLRPPDHPWQFVADPLPEEMDTADERVGLARDARPRPVDGDAREGRAARA